MTTTLAQPSLWDGIMAEPAPADGPDSPAAAHATSPVTKQTSSAPVPHPRDAERQIIAELERLCAEHGGDAADDLDGLVEKSCQLLNKVLTHMDRPEGTDSIRDMAKEVGLPHSTAVRVLHELGVRNAQSSRSPLRGVIVERGDPFLDMGLGDEFLIPRNTPKESREQIANLIDKIEPGPAADAFVRRFMERGVLDVVADGNTRHALVGFTWSFVQRVAARFRQGNLAGIRDLVVEKTQRKDGKTETWLNYDLAVQFVRAWRLLDVTRRDAVDAARTFRSGWDTLPVDEIRDLLVKMMWLAEDQVIPLVNRIDRTEDCPALRQQFRFLADRMTQAAAVAAARPDRQHSSRYEPSCVAHLRPQQVHRLAELRRQTSDAGLVQAETALYEEITSADASLKKDEDRLRHMCRLAVSLPGGVEKLRQALERRSETITWQQPFREYLLETDRAL